MGIIFDGLAIALGSFLGSKSRKTVSKSFFSILGISVMIISAVGFIENIFSVEDKTLLSNRLIVVVLSLIIGTLLGELLKIEKLFRKDTGNANAILEATLFFAIGGLQISGPVLLAINGDNSQLILKSLIDLPFAIMLGAALGVGCVFSAIPVMLVQAVIFFISYTLGSVITETMISQLCSMGYIILFFTGFNLNCSVDQKINNVNMLPAIIINVAVNAVMEGIK